jgi:hypothetical protein
MLTLSLTASQKILVIGPTYDRLDKLLEINKLLQEYDWIIINGGITYCKENIIDSMNQMDQLLNSGKVIYNKDQYDLTAASQINILDKKELYIEQWLKNKPNVVVAIFPNGYRVIIVSGGITDNLSFEKLNNNLEVSFISHNWHQTYSGGLGYVISNNPPTTGAPKFHRYSAQIGNIYQDNFQTYALKIDQYGIQRTIIL